MGGSDQWGNIVTGTELIRRMADGSAFALTTPLIKKADGTKFGKSEHGNVWLDPDRTSPYRFYQYWLNASDEDAANFIRIFSIREREDLETLIAAHGTAPHERRLQQALAKEITERVHSPEAYAMAVQASSILFGNAVTDELQRIDESTLLSVLEGVPQIEITQDALASCASITDLLSETTRGTIFASKGEARRMIAGGGVSVNKIKVEDGNAKPVYPLLQSRYLLAQKGKKNYYLIAVR